MKTYVIFMCVCFASLFATKSEAKPGSPNPPPPLIELLMTNQIFSAKIVEKSILTDVNEEERAYFKSIQQAPMRCKVAVLQKENEGFNKRKFYYIDCYDFEIGDTLLISGFVYKNDSTLKVQDWYGTNKVSFDKSQLPKDLSYYYRPYQDFYNYQIFRLFASISAQKGNFTLFYPNKKPMVSGIIYNGARIGRWRLYYEDGLEYKTIVYGKNNQPIMETTHIYDLAKNSMAFGLFSRGSQSKIPHSDNFNNTGFSYYKSAITTAYPTVLDRKMEHTVSFFLENRDSILTKKITDDWVFETIKNENGYVFKYVIVEQTKEKRMMYEHFITRLLAKVFWVVILG
jgi:hypothetical protein